MPPPPPPAHACTCTHVYDPSAGKMLVYCADVWSTSSLRTSHMDTPAVKGTLGSPGVTDLQGGGGGRHHES